MTNPKAAVYIAERLQLEQETVYQVINLIDQGNTVPFIARYRKEQTKGLDPTVLRHIEALHQQQSDVKIKVESVKKKIGNKLTHDLTRLLDNTHSAEEVDELYAPFKQGSKGTLAGRARGLGLEPAALLMIDPDAQMVNLGTYVKQGIQGLKNLQQVALGVQHIVADIISKDQYTLDELKTLTAQFPPYLESSLSAKARKEKKKEMGGDTKYQPYHNFSKNISGLQPHQVLAINRAEMLKILTVKVSTQSNMKSRFLSFAHHHWIPNRAQDDKKGLLRTSMHDAYSRLLEPMVCRRTRAALTKKAEKESTDIFTKNLFHLLLSPPIKGKSVLALDPGYTNGCKIAMLSPTGSVLDTGLIFPIGRKANYIDAKSMVTSFIKMYRCETVAIGNGTGCRETEAFIAKLIKDGAFLPLDVVYCIVREDGASIYSASKEGSAELPGLDLTMRGAVSIGRRLQDPLLELVKIEPKHLGIGMYQHDIPERLLRGALSGVITDCVSFVGVDVNAASLTTLRLLPSLNDKKAQAIIEWRTRNQRFTNRKQLLQIKGMGKKSYEQCVGFLRVLPAPADQDDGTSRDAVQHSNAQHSNAQNLIIILSDSDDDDDVSLVRRKRKQPGRDVGRGFKKQKSVSSTSMSANPLDMTFIHPESYDVAQRFMDMAAVHSSDIGQPRMKTAIGALLDVQTVTSIADRLDVGTPTLQLVIDGLRQPTDYDIRSSFEKPLFKKGLKQLEDLHTGTQLTGRVTNVTTFGAFVDCGVGNDGLIHTSRMAGRGDLAPGDVVEVTVINVDLQKGKFGLRLVSVGPRLQYKLLTATSFTTT